MEKVIRIYVGSCVRNTQAEEALKWSLEKHTSGMYSVCWMRDVGIEDDEFTGWDKRGWGTGFTPFRWIVPQLKGFTGRAIYLDVDTLCLGDLRDLWTYPIMPGKAVVSIPGNYSVMLIDCERFQQVMPIADIEQWKKRSCNPPFKGLFNEYTTFLEENDLVQELPEEWNSFDKLNDKTKILHFTGKDTQPWCPYPERHCYKRHPDPRCEKLWWEYHDDSVRDYYNGTT